MRSRDWQWPPVWEALDHHDEDAKWLADMLARRAERENARRETLTWLDLDRIIGGEA